VSAMNRVRAARDGAVGRITLARPEKKNAIDLAMARGLLEAVNSRARS
jgi:enoyl-CoA hydratase/carnithine racemase